MVVHEKALGSPLESSSRGIIDKLRTAGVTESVRTESLIPDFSGLESAKKAYKPLILLG